MTEVVNDYEYRKGLKRIEFEDGMPNVMPRVEKIMLQVGGRYGQAFDLGANCYLKRESYKDGGAWSKTGKQIVLSSFCQYRADVLKVYLDFLFSLDYTNRSVSSLNENFQQFLDFCDGINPNQNQLLLDRTEENVRKFLESIKSYYTQRKNISGIWHFFCHLYEIDGLDREITRQFWFNGNAETKPIAPLLDDEVQDVINFYKALFKLGYDMLVQNKPFPYKWEVPAFLGEKNNRYILLPCTGSTRGYYHRRQVEKNKKSTSFFNHEFNNWKTVDEYRFNYPDIGKSALSGFPSRVENTKKFVNKVNKNSQHETRIYYGRLGMLAYRNLFMLLLGANNSGIEGFKDYGDIPWGDEFQKQSYAKSYWKFTYIKGRANYKKVEFILFKEDFALFNQYLDLRKNLVESYGKSLEDCGLLFFHYSQGRFKAFEGQALTNGFVSHFKEVPRINSQISRATKSDILLHLTNDVRAVAHILQNTPQTVIRNYARGTVRGHVQEIGDFLGNLSVVVKRNQRKSDEIESAVGECEVLDPKAIEGAPEKITPNCRSKEGCLFCDKYRVHADERDIRKLLSYLYVIQEAELTLSQTEQFEVFFKPIIERITAILEYIKQISSEYEVIVLRLEDEVLEGGELSEFFIQELELQEELKNG
jgi:hypothetical protein